MATPDLTLLNAAPELDANGDVTCGYAQAALAQATTGLTALAQGRSWSWNGRSLSMHNIGDLQKARAYWQGEVQRICNAGRLGFRRRPLGYIGGGSLPCNPCGGSTSGGTADADTDTGLPDLSI